jgi:hypothetical protein
MQEADGEPLEPLEDPNRQLYFLETAWARDRHEYCLPEDVVSSPPGAPPDRRCAAAVGL